MSQTIGDVRKLIKKAKIIYVRPFFGVYEGWVKISKIEALHIFKAHADNVTVFRAFDFDQPLQIDGAGNLDIG